MSHKAPRRKILTLDKTNFQTYRPFDREVVRCEFAAT
jgi:hypothetical protein